MKDFTVIGFYEETSQIFVTTYQRLTLRKHSSRLLPISLMQR
ncbi:hypothetical protein REH81_05055 [Vibrio rotiferianus]